jgi:hypothetical protein
MIGVWLSEWLNGVTTTFMSIVRSLLGAILSFYLIFFKLKVYITAQPLSRNHVSIYLFIFTYIL